MIIANALFSNTNTFNNNSEIIMDYNNFHDWKSGSGKNVKKSLVI